VKPAVQGHQNWSHAARGAAKYIHREADGGAGGGGQRRGIRQAIVRSLV